MPDASHGERKRSESTLKRGNSKDIKSTLSFLYSVVFISNSFGLPVKWHADLSEHCKCTCSLGKQNGLFNIAFKLM